MNTRFYICWFRLDRQDGYLIWRTNDSDGVHVDQGSVPAFRDLQSLRSYADKLNLEISHETPVCHDLDQLADWLTSRDPNTLHPSTFLDAWNLFSDISKSLSLQFESRSSHSHAVYDKLFYASNLPSITPEGQKFEPNWTVNETNTLERVLSDGIEMFRQVIQYVP